MKTRTPALGFRLAFIQYRTSPQRAEVSLLQQFGLITIKRHSVSKLRKYVKKKKKFPYCYINFRDSLCKCPLEQHRHTAEMIHRGKCKKSTPGYSPAWHCSSLFCKNTELCQKGHSRRQLCVFWNRQAMRHQFWMSVKDIHLHTRMPSSLWTHCIFLQDTFRNRHREREKKKSKPFQYLKEAWV